MATRKRIAAASRRPQRMGSKDAPLTPIVPVRAKVGESPGNLKARERAFQNRRGQRKG